MSNVSLVLRVGHSGLITLHVRYTAVTLLLFAVPLILMASVPEDDVLGYFSLIIDLTGLLSFMSARLGVMNDKFWPRRYSHRVLRIPFTSAHLHSGLREDSWLDVVLCFSHRYPRGFDDIFVPDR